MNVLTSHASVSELNTPLLVVPVTAGDSRGAAFEAADAVAQGRLSAIADEESYKGKPGKTLLVHTSELGARRMLLVGMGKADDLEVTGARSLAATAVQAANARHLSGVTVLLPAEMNGAGAVAMAAQGAVLGGYRYDTYLTVDVEELTCESVTLAGTDGDLGTVVERASAVAEAVATARDLVNGPPADVTPVYLAKVAKEIAEA